MSHLDPSIRMPVYCPLCQKELYPMRSQRPDPRSSQQARFFWVLAGTVAGLIYLISMLVTRHLFSWKEFDFSDNGIVVYRTLPAPVLAVICLPIALAPGLGIGWLASRLPRVRRLRCWNCSWKKTYPQTAMWEYVPETTVSAGSSEENPVIADGDTWSDCRAWARGELQRGRLAEDVAADLAAQGWRGDEVELMVDQVRRELRQSTLNQRRAGA